MPATILIVDDSRMIRTLVRDALAPAHYRIVEAANGREALDRVDDAAPELVITDVNMPEMNGLGLIRALRERPRYRYTPILVLTTESGADLMQQGRAAGATGWLVKPFDPEQLRETVLWALGLREKALRKLGSVPT